MDDGRGRRFSVREGMFADFAVGRRVTLRLSSDQKRVTAAAVEGPTLLGIVKAMDSLKKMTIAITTCGRDGPQDEMIHVAQDAIALLDDRRGRRLWVKEARWSGIPAGAAVQVRLTPAQKTATLLRAEGPSLPAQLKAVSAAKGTETVVIRRSREDAEEKTFEAAKTAQIVLDGKDARLADLKGGDDGPFVQVRLALDQKTVHGLFVDQGRRE